MVTYGRCVAMAALLAGVASTASAQGSTTPAQANAFMGTWVFAMTNPAGSQHTVKIWDRDGAVAASVQIDKFPPRDVTAVFADGDMLVLTISHGARPPLLENGMPIWAVISLTRNGDTLEMAQMLERSQTIKRGTGRKQSD